jgi:hypothetical protein
VQLCRCDCVDVKSCSESYSALEMVSLGFTTSCREFARPTSSHAYYCLGWFTWVECFSLSFEIHGLQAQPVDSVHAY